MLGPLSSVLMRSSRFLPPLAGYDCFELSMSSSALLQTSSPSKGHHPIPLCLCSQATVSVSWETVLGESWEAVSRTVALSGAQGKHRTNALRM